jgi:ribosomal protein S12 methylthiotransferase
MTATLEHAGFVVTDDTDAADVVVVNTCAFIEDAVEESIEIVMELARDWKAGSDERRLVVAGCMPSRYGTDLEEALHEADAFVPVAEEGRLAEVVAEVTGAPFVPAETTTTVRSHTPDGATAYLSVSDGCDRACTFCTIPLIRGPFRSVPAETLLEEASGLVRNGARELVLVGQDTSAYRDGATRLPQLVRRLGSLQALDWLRVMYVQPDGVTDELLDAMAATPVVCHYLDVPIQHVAEDVLRRMGRGGGETRFLDMLERTRAAMSDVSLRTTLIAGFPGEREEDVDRLVAFLREARFDHAGVFVYSPEEGTPAAALDGLLPYDERLARAQAVRDAADEAGAEAAASRVGTTVEVLVEEEEDGAAVGRWRGQAPEVDGAVLLDGSAPPGSMVDARIVDSVGPYLVGEVT